MGWPGTLNPHDESTGQPKWKGIYSPWLLKEGRTIVLVDYFGFAKKVMVSCHFYKLMGPL